MTVLLSLWLPILLSAVLVFVASSLLHMVLGYHAADWQKLPEEDAVQEALRRFQMPPGDYALPCPTSAAHQQSDEFKAKQAKGPVLVMTTWPSGPQNMTGSLVLWFVYAVVVGTVAALVAGTTIPPGADGHLVFHTVALVAFAGYSLALAQHSIWYHRRWRTTLVSMADGLIYALLTAGVFAWLWPNA
jgi:hypothetical protein